MGGPGAETDAWGPSARQLSWKEPSKILVKPGFWLLVLIALIVLDFVYVPGHWRSGGALRGPWPRGPGSAGATGRHTITARQLVVSSGILYRKSKTVPISRITSVDFEQGILDRIFDCGPLIVNDTSADQPLRFRDVSSAQRGQHTLNEHIHAR